MRLGQCLGLMEFRLGQHMGREQSQVAQPLGDQNLARGFWARAAPGSLALALSLPSTNIY